VARWHERIDAPTAADGILDRLVHNAHRVEMREDYMRTKRGAQPSSWRRRHNRIASVAALRTLFAFAAILKVFWVVLPRGINAC